MDSFECSAVTGDAVCVRTSADPDSAVVTRASSSTFVRSPVDYRAIFQRTSGQWRLQAFVAGD